MDIPSTGTALIILVAFLLPGFVTVLMQERTFKSAEDPTDLDRLMRIALYSGLSYTLLALLALVEHWHKANFVNFFDAHRGRPALLVLVGFLAVVVPSAVVWLITLMWSSSKTRETIFSKGPLNARHNEPTAWDYFMRQRKPAFVRVTFRNGGRLLGYYGATSFAAYAKDGGDFYLEQVWTTTNDEDEWFDAAIPGTQGVWVSASDVVFVEFYTVGNVTERSPRSPADPEADRDDPQIGVGSAGAPSTSGQSDRQDHAATGAEQEG